MKKVICIVMIAALLALSSAGIAEVTGPAYLGPWICGRAILDITDEHPGYRVEISWAGSAAEATTWTYHCPYELVDGSLVSEPTGVMVTETYSEDGEVAKSVTAYEDGQATFTKFTISYFNMIGDAELSLDKKACEALNFAAASELWRADVDAMRDNMFKAWEGLTEAEQSAFDGSFMDVVKLLDACFEDWEANRSAFTDGREGRMDELLAEPLYRDAWDTLKANTLTLGNSEG